MRYIYVDKVGAGPEHPSQQWGLYSDVLTAEQARARYEMDPPRSEDWFGVVPDTGDERPSMFLEVAPQAGGINLVRLNEYGSVIAQYGWGQLEAGSGDSPPERRLFLNSITTYAYPDEAGFLRRNKALGFVDLTFKPDGYVREGRAVNRGFGQPRDVETREFRDVPMEANWFEVPEFGAWEPFFHPDPKD